MPDFRLPSSRFQSVFSPARSSRHVAGGLRGACSAGNIGGLSRLDGACLLVYRRDVIWVITVCGPGAVGLREGHGTAIPFVGPRQEANSPKTALGERASLRWPNHPTSEPNAHSRPSSRTPGWRNRLHTQRSCCANISSRTAPWIRRSNY